MRDPRAVPERLGAALADRYRIERELGQGGMATVYLAEDLKHDRKVALKVLKPELAAVLGADRFVVEIKTTASLQHPHILPLFDSGTADGFLYYVMPYIQGETLRSKLDRETQLGIDEAVRLASDVADALHYAHQHGVIHRDIKPENILLANGRSMVADFGIALAVSAAAGGRMTETGLSLGTPHYMSPEQATAEKELTARSDIYSLGSVLYEMLTGAPPHHGGSAQQIIMKIIAEPAAPVTTVRKSVPPHVAAAVAKAIEKLPADRFESAARFAEALGNPGFTTAKAAGASGSAAPATRARRLLVPALATAALFAAALALWGWLRPRPAAPVLRYSMRMPDGEGVSIAAPVLGNRLALSPDGTLLAYIGGDGSPLGPGLWLRRRDELHAQRITGSLAARRPFFSPDGTRIGYFGPNGTLWVAGLAGEPPRSLNTDDLFEAGRGAWGRDGYIYATARAGNGIVRLPEAGGPVERISTIDSAAGEAIHQYPSVLPGGNGLLFVVRGGGGAGPGDRIVGMDLKTRRRHALVSGVAAWFVAPGELLYVTAAGTLMAAPFAEERLELTGPGRPILDSVGVTRLGVDLTLSANGTLMFLSGTAGFAVQPAWVDRQGRVDPVDPAWSFTSAAIYSSVALSPDYSRLAVSQGTASGQQVWVKQLPRGPNQQLTFEGALNSRATWTADGRSVVFVSDRSGINKIWRQVADGSAPAELMAPVAANDGLLSPDGAWFIYRSIAGDRHIYARRTVGDTGALVVARSSRGEELAPSLSPDGRWIAYVSTESGRTEVYLRPFPEVNRAKLQASVAGGLEPRWSRDGTELFYRDEADRLVSVSIERRGQELAPGTPRVLFSMQEFIPANVYQATYDVAPGGRFVMGKRLDPVGGAGLEQLIVVENLGELLRRP